MTEGASAIAATAGGSLLALPILVPAAGVLLSFLLGGRQAERIALGLMPVQFGVAVAIASSDLALRRTARLCPRRLCPAARDRAQGRRIFGGHAGDGFADHAGRRALRPGQFRDAERSDGEAGAAGLLDSVAGDPGGVEPHLSGRRSVQSLCRARASHLRRGALGLSRRPSGNVGRGAALSAVRAVRRAVLSARRGVALWGLRHARHRPPVSAHPRRAGRMARGRADDRRTLGEDRPVPAPPLAAAGARQRARRRERRAFGAGGQGVVLSHCAALVRCPAGAAQRGSRRPFSPRSVRRRSSPAACSPCVRSG